MRVLLRLRKYLFDAQAFILWGEKVGDLRTLDVCLTSQKVLGDYSEVDLRFFLPLTRSLRKYTVSTSWLHK